MVGSIIFFYDKITEQFKKSIDRDKKYLFYLNEFVLKSKNYGWKNCFLRVNEYWR